MHFFQYDVDYLHVHHSLDTEPVYSDYALHTHELLELLVFRQGNVVSWVEGIPRKLEVNDVVLYNIGEIHRVEITPSIPYERIVIIFSKDLFSKFDTEGELIKPFLSRTPGTSNILHASDFKSKYWLSCVENLIAPSENRELQIITNMLPLLNEVKYAFENNQKNHLYNGENIATSNIIARVIDYINMHFSQNMTIDELASTFYIGKSRLYQIFKEQTGTTPYNYIIHKRLIYARKLMRLGVPFQEILSYCGFADYTSFFRAYKKLFGSSPRQDLKTKIPLQESIIFKM